MPFCNRASFHFLLSDLFIPFQLMSDLRYKKTLCFFIVLKNVIYCIMLLSTGIDQKGGNIMSDNNNPIPPESKSTSKPENFEERAGLDCSETSSVPSNEPEDN